MTRDISSKNADFENTLSATELHAWDAIKAVISNVSGGNRASPEETKDYVKNMMNAMKRIGSTMTLKMHLLNNHLNDFIKQSPNESDEHGEHFHQTAMPAERRFKGKRLDAMLAEVCWVTQKVHLYEANEDDENDVDVED